MTRFYFDVEEDGRLGVDTEGTELASAEAARFEATQTLAELVRDALPGRRAKHFTITVRDDNQTQHFVMDLRFTTR